MDQSLLKIQNMINAHPERVRLLLAKYGFAVPVTLDNVALAAVASPDFAVDLKNVFSFFANADGDTGTSDSDWVNTLISWGMSLLGSFGLGGDQPTSSEEQITLLQQQIAMQQQQQQQMQTYMLIGGIALVVIIMFMFVFQKH